MTVRADSGDGALPPLDPAHEQEPSSTPIGQRMLLESYNRDNPFVLTAHRPNFVLPLVLIDDAGQAISSDLDEELQSVEFQFQFSLKVLLLENLYNDRGLLSVAYTNRSFWQAYNRDLSSAFRETNHEPELILTLEGGRTWFGFQNTANQFIFNHQSNGRFGELSRSWNRLMLNMIFERDNVVLALRPWYRIPEGDKESPDDPGGDDNPDIERYLGNFDLTGAWVGGDRLYTVMVRNNLRRGNNYGAIELGWSFPLNRRLRGYVKAFHGHGESLVNYDLRTTSLGVGLLISDWL